MRQVLGRVVTVACAGSLLIALFCVARFDLDLGDVQRSLRKGDSIVDCDTPSSIVPAHGSSGGSKAGEVREAVVGAGVESDGPSQRKGVNDWTWFGGDLNEYYNKLERDQHAKRKPGDISSYAVHRWLGEDRSTLMHYQLIHEAILEHVTLGGAQTSLRRIFDAGCGLGAGLMWFEQQEPGWELVGHTISEDQYKWITTDLPSHRFQVRLHTYDEPFGSALQSAVDMYDAVYSIEAAIHSPSLQTSIKAWSDALRPGGVVVLIDDFRAAGTDRNDEELQLFDKAWIVNVPSTLEVAAFAEASGLELVRDRDLGTEFQIVKRNYHDQVPEWCVEAGGRHQAWLGTRLRQRLMVQGKITYRLVVLKKRVRV